MRHYKVGRVAKKAGFGILVACIVAVFAFPFFWMILSSFKYTVDIVNTAQPFSFAPTLDNYRKVFIYQNLADPMVNSTIIAVCSMGLSMFFGLQAAYSIAVNKQRWAGSVILLIRIIPIITFLIPWYMIFSKIGLVGSFTSLILTHMLMLLPFIVWVMVPSFQSIPTEMRDAATVDGCSNIGTFYRIMVPMAVPSILTTTIMSFIFSWNNFMFSLVFSGAKTHTLPMAIYQFIAYEGADWGAVMADAVCITTPILLLCLCLQKYIVQGLTAGAVKG